MVSKTPAVALVWVTFGLIIVGLALTVIGMLSVQSQISDVIVVQYLFRYFIGWIMLLSISPGLMVVGLIFLGVGVIMLLVTAILTSLIEA
jgi:hypothetical protein